LSSKAEALIWVSQRISNLAFFDWVKYKPFLLYLKGRTGKGSPYIMFVGANLCYRPPLPKKQFNTEKGAFPKKGSLSILAVAK